MTLSNNLPAAEGHRAQETRAAKDDVQALHDKLDRLLARAKPTKRELTQQQFRGLYPRLETHLAGGKLLRDVLAAFNELAQAKVCARTFNDMLNQERARRDEAGSSICCASCGHPLKPPGPSAGAAPAPTASLPDALNPPESE